MIICTLSNTKIKTYFESTCYCDCNVGEVIGGRYLIVEYGEDKNKTEYKSGEVVRLCDLYNVEEIRTDIELDDISFLFSNPYTYKSNDTTTTWKFYKKNTMIANCVCNHCGALIELTDEYCRKCGSKLNKN